MKGLIRLVTLVVLGCGVALAAPARDKFAVVTEGATSCKFEAYAIDPDPRGTNIRAAPRANATVLGWMAPRRYMARTYSIGSLFDVVGSKNGWLLIKNAREDAPFDQSQTYAFAGPGWIWGGFAGFAIGDERLFAAPSANARVKLWLMDEGRNHHWTGMDFDITAIHACHGEFAEVSVRPRYDKRARTQRGWMFNFCTLQLTPCDYPYPSGVDRPTHYKFPG